MIAEHRRSEVPLDWPALLQEGPKYSLERIHLLTIDKTSDIEVLNDHSSSLRNISDGHSGRQYTGRRQHLRRHFSGTVQVAETQILFRGGC